MVIKLTEEEMREILARELARRGFRPTSGQFGGTVDVAGKRFTDLYFQAEIEETATNPRSPGNASQSAT